MSTYYKIGEIAALYGISTDILRYYEELGILVPRRAPNGYRIYRTEDLWCLNVIRDLRDLGFSMDQIRSYIENRSVGSTLELFQQEMCLIDQQIARLQGLRDNIIPPRDHRPGSPAAAGDHFLKDAARTALPPDHAEL